MARFQVGQLVKEVDPVKGYELFRFEVKEVWEDYDPAEYFLSEDCCVRENTIEMADPNERVFKIDAGEYHFLIAAESAAKAKSTLMRTEWGDDLRWADIKSCRRYRPEALTEAGL